MYKPTDSEQRLNETRATLDALRREEVDAIVGSRNVMLVRPQEAERQLRENIERFRTMADDLPAKVWVHDDEGKIQFVNRRFCEFFGVTEQDMRSTRGLDLLHPDDAEACVQEFQRCVRERQPFRATLRVRRADGAWRWIESFSRPRFSTTGEYLGGVGVSTDVTERRELEQQRDELLESERAARCTMERLSQAKDEFLSLISHELRTPLATVLGWSSLLRRGNRSPEDTEFAIDAIVRGGQELKQLIEDLLDMSRIASGKLKCEFVPVDLVELARLALTDFRPLAEEKNIQLSEVIASASAIVSGDTRRLRQVLANLLSNAIKFTPADGRVCLRLSANPQRVLITVEDTGIGIAPSRLAELFCRFRQADSSIARKYHGLGLGLALVKQITEMHGGSVHAASEGEGRGATVVVELPRISEAAQPDRELSVPSDVLAGIRAVVVDDDRAALRLMARIFEEAGADVIECTAASEALVALEAHACDVLISDISMPEVDGYSLLRKVRELPESRRAAIPAIAVTAFGREEDMHRAVEAGYQAHHSKPIDPAELCRLARELVHGAHRDITPAEGGGTQVR
jgi:PAS domain S-box-containing protein